LVGLGAKFCQTEELEGGRVFCISNRGMEASRKFIPGQKFIVREDLTMSDSQIASSATKRNGAEVVF